jgi:hypothetical protein
LLKKDKNSTNYTALGNCKMIVAICVNANKKLSEKLTMAGDKYVVLEYIFITKKLISLSRVLAFLANKNRELTVSTNLVQVKNQWQARICQQLSLQEASNSGISPQGARISRKEGNSKVVPSKVGTPLHLEKTKLSEVPGKSLKRLGQAKAVLEAYCNRGCIASYLQKMYHYIKKQSTPLA